MPVYFVQAEDGGPVKIGFSRFPENRLQELQNAHHSRLRIIGLIPDGSRADEKKLHREFESQRLRGEWFLPAGEILFVAGQYPYEPPCRPKEFGPGPLARQFTLEIESFLSANSMSASRFGSLALNDPTFVFELRKGRAVRVDVFDRVRRFMRDSEAA